MATQLIANYEISSQFDGVNTTITLAQPVYVVSDINIGGAQYFNFTFVAGATTIELADVFATGTLGFIDYYPTAQTGIGTGLTVEACRDRLERHFDDPLGDVSDTLFLDWLNDLNYIVYDLLMNINPGEYISTQTISITSGTDTYSLPSDFSNMKILGCGVYEDDSNTELEYTGYKSSLSGYYIKQNQIFFTPEPTQAKDVQLRYIPELAELEDDADKILLTRRNFLVVLNYLDKSYGRWNIDLTRENNSDQRFTRALRTMLRTVAKTPNVFII